jgi:hypothetical protein
MFDLVANRTEAQPVFAVAAGVLGRSGRFVREAAPADQFSDRSGQIHAAQALAARAALGTAWPARAVIAGYSIGELAAWVRWRRRWAGICLGNAARRWMRLRETAVSLPSWPPPDPSRSWHGTRSHRDRRRRRQLCGRGRRALQAAPGGGAGRSAPLPPVAAVAHAPPESSDGQFRAVLREASHGCRAPAIVS